MENLDNKILKMSQSPTMYVTVDYYVTIDYYYFKLKKNDKHNEFKRKS